MVSENFTASGDVSSFIMFCTQPGTLEGSIEEGNGRPGHEVRSAHMCSTSSTSGGVTSPCPAATI
jgi:hypothetical protein